MLKGWLQSPLGKGTCKHFADALSSSDLSEKKRVG